MDPALGAVLVSLVTSLAEHAPEIAMALTGTETPEDAILRARKAVQSVRPLGDRISAAAEKRRAELAAAREREDEPTVELPPVKLGAPIALGRVTLAPRIDLGDDEGEG